MDNEQFRQCTLNFESALKEMAAVHMEAGDDTSAGLLLVAERRVYSTMLLYYARVPPEGWATETPTPKVKRRSKKAAAQAEIPET